LFLDTACDDETTSLVALKSEALNLLEGFSLADSSLDRDCAEGEAISGEVRAALSLLVRSAGIAGSDDLRPIPEPVEA
jgi:hypothetical protein